MPYAQGTVSAELRDVHPLETLDIAEVPALENIRAAALKAFESPIGMTGNVFSGYGKADQVLILVSDSFRTTRMEQVLPALLDGLSAKGAPDENMNFLFATGTHRPPTPEEQARILGDEVYRRFETRLHVHDAHNPEQLIHVGTTSRGTEVWVNRLAAEADRVIATGTVVLHYFGGFGGGRKSVVPGIAGVNTIAHNHAMNLDPEEDRLNPDVRIGVLDGNPVAEDMLEASKLVRIDFILNTVLNRHGEIAGLFAGEMDAAHRAAAEFAGRLYMVPIHKRADLVIASTGNAKNFVQSHKALYNAYQAVKPTGRIVFLTPCAEGLGGEQFCKWLRLGSRSAIIGGLRKQAEINGQTALSTIEKAPITHFVTEMSDSEVTLMGGRKAVSFQHAIDAALAEIRQSGISSPTCYLMPSASYTVPMQSQE